MVDDERDAGARQPVWRHGGLIAAVVVGIAAAVGVATSSIGAGGTPAPTPSSSPSRAVASVPPPSLVPGPTSGPPVITRATAADLQWTRSGGFLTCSGLVINVRVRTTGEVTQVLAQLLRVSGGATTRLTLSGSDGLWSASSLELNAPSEWRVRVVAVGPGGTDVRFAEITAPDDSGTTLRHVCPD